VCLAGKTVSMKGSGPKPHELVFSKETNVYKCTCPVWRNVPLRENDKTCRHLIMIRSRNTEMGRVGEEVRLCVSLSLSLSSM